MAEAAGQEEIRLGVVSGAEIGLAAGLQRGRTRDPAGGRERPTEPLRVAAVQAYATFTDPQVAKNLVALWAKATPGMRSEIEAALATRNDRVPVLLEALEKGVIKKDKFSPNTIAALRRQKDAATVARVNKLFGVPAKAKSRAQAVKDLLPALKLKGDAAAGQ